jgi:kynureninase
MNSDVFSSSDDFARRLDRKDELAGLAKLFEVPERTVYLLGNSLGPPLKRSLESVGRVADEWRELAIRGWWEGDPPWFGMGERLGALAAGLIGAEAEEVTATATTTINLHSMLHTFYEPDGDRTRILMDELDFPTDLYAIQGHLAMRGYDPAENLLLARSPDGRTLDEGELIELMDERVALVLLPSVLFRSGQLLDVERLAKAARERGIPFGLDCCHSAGVVPHSFSEQGVDFAVFCGYKYLCGGPGAPAFIYVAERHFERPARMAGWFGCERERQFEMLPDFHQARSAAGWQISSPPVLGAAPLQAALETIGEVGVERLRQKSLRLTSYLISLVDELLPEARIATPREPERRGGHVALELDGDVDVLAGELGRRGIVLDARPPNVVRICPSPLFNGFADVREAVLALASLRLKAEDSFR